MEAYLQGLTMGLAYVAPIGLQNLFVINTALTQKRSRAYLTALIVIFFDVTLAFACFFGIGAIMQRFEWLRMAVLLVGSGIVIWIGIGLLRDRGPEDTAAAVDVPWAKVVTTACVVTWFNPQATASAGTCCASSTSSAAVSLFFTAENSSGPFFRRSFLSSAHNSLFFALIVAWSTIPMVYC